MISVTKFNQPRESPMIARNDLHRHNTARSQASASPFHRSPVLEDGIRNEKERVMPIWVGS